MRWAAASSITSAEIVATPSRAADGLERIGAAGDDRHPGAVRDQGLDQSQAKATASAGDDDSLVFQAHRFCSRVCVQLGRLRLRKGVKHRRGGTRLF